MRPDLPADLPALGQGTWKLGERGADRQAEADALRLGIDLGMTLIDTAEMYADGGAEEVVAMALAGQRERAVLVSKAYPHNAGRRSLPRACEASLRRLGTERIDLYLLHWPGQVPLDETVVAFEDLVAAGKIGAWGVSNFDLDLMQRLPPGCADEPGALQPRQPRDRVRPAAVVPGAGDAGDGLLAGGPGGLAAAGPGAARRRFPARGEPGPGGDRLDAAARRGQHSQRRPTRRTCARTRPRRRCA